MGGAAPGSSVNPQPVSFDILLRYDYVSCLILLIVRATRPLVRAYYRTLVCLPEAENYGPICNVPWAVVLPARSASIHWSAERTSKTGNQIMRELLD